MKRTIKSILIVLALATIVFAQAIAATCPYDGDSATLTHTVGFGQQRVCWYAHLHYENGRYVRHQFYQSCPVQ